MKIRQYKDTFVKKLTPVYGSDEAESFFYLTLERLHGLRRIDLALSPDTILSDAQLLRWDHVCEQLSREIPIQYVLGVTHFYELDIKVDPSVLIPRPETEELVQWIIQSCSKPGPRILDIGTGSGCIAIALSKNLPDARVDAIDISSDALQLAKFNAKANGAAVNFLQQDILTTETLPKYDYIVSNPPYVRDLEKSEIKPNVINNEPHLALFVADADALLFYRKIADLALHSLSESGLLFFEINQYLAKETIQLLTDLGYSCELRKDIYGNDRMIKAAKTYS